MDWTPIIDRNREALLAIAATVLAMLAGAAGRMPRKFQRPILRLLIPAESAVRRLIVLAAKDVVAELPPKRETSASKSSKTKSGSGKSRAPVFRIADKRKSFAHLVNPPLPKNRPLIWTIDDVPLVKNLPQFRPAKKPRPDGLVDTDKLRRRVEAMINALNNLPRQAIRLAHWRLRQALKVPTTYTSPIRPGRAPGHRRKPTHIVDELLCDLHAFAFEALHPNTS